MVQKLVNDSSDTSTAPIIRGHSHDFVDRLFIFICSQIKINLVNSQVSTYIHPDIPWKM